MQNVVVATTARQALTANRHVAWVSPARRYRQQHTQPNGRSSVFYAQPVARDETGAHRIRQHGNKALPLPPLLDDVVQEAMTRHSAPKPRLEAEENLTEFQKELLSNSYAQALASPVRKCALTHARLPAHFLQPFSSVIEKREDEAGPQQYPKVRAIFEPGLPSKQDSVRFIPTAAYITNRQDTVEQIGKQNSWTVLISTRILEHFALLAGISPNSIKKKHRWEWRAGIPTEVERRHECEADAALRLLVLHSREYLVPADKAIARLDEIVFFVRFESDSRRIETMHGRPCYCWNGPFPDAAFNEVAGMSFGLTRHARTLKAILALDRVFSYKDTFTAEKYQITTPG